jgi:hypothetical protein
VFVQKNARGPQHSRHQQQEGENEMRTAAWPRHPAPTGKLQLQVVDQ